MSVTVHHADALDVLPTIKTMSVDLVVTDPPYIIGAVSAGNLSSKSGTWADMLNSSRWFRDWYIECKRVLKPTGALWTFCNWRSLPVVMKAASDADWSIASTLVWHKDWIGPGGSVGLRPSYELAALLPMPDFQIPDRGVPDMWTVPWSSHKPSGHPAEKPQALMRRIIEVSGCGAGSVVLDPFAGSGTTLRAAAELGCVAIGCEADERWADHCRAIEPQMCLVAA